MFKRSRVEVEGAQCARHGREVEVKEASAHGVDNRLAVLPNRRVRVARAALGS